METLNSLQSANSLKSDTCSGLDSPVSVAVNELRIGRTIDFPIYDGAGVLLLSAGSKITERFKELLKRRNQESVQVDQIHASKLTEPDNSDLSDLVGVIAKQGLGVELANKLDQMTEGGSMFVKNTGPALKDRLVSRGRQFYNQQQREEFCNKHRDAGRLLDHVMTSALKGEMCHASQMMGVVGHYLNAMTDDMDLVMSVAAEARSDQRLAEHCQKLSMYAMAIGVEYGLCAGNIEKLGLCGLVHDWGMLKVPSEIRNKPKFPNPLEQFEIKKHPIHSLEMLEKIEGLPHTVPLICYQVHEQMNGNGYPRGRKGEQIHRFSRMLKVADIYVTLTSQQSYRPPVMAAEAMEALLGLSAEGLIDDDCVQKLLIALSMYPVGSLVELSDGSVAQSIRRNGLKFNKPIIRIVRSAKGETTDPNDESTIVDISQSDLRIIRPLPYPGSNEISLSSEIYTQARL